MLPASLKQESTLVVDLLCPETEDVDQSSEIPDAIETKLVYSVQNGDGVVLLEHTKDSKSKDSVPLNADTVRRELQLNLADLIIVN